MHKTIFYLYAYVQNLEKKDSSFHSTLSTIDYIVLFIIRFLTLKVPPSSMLLFQTRNNKENDSGSTFIHVQEGSSTSITCTSTGSFPAVELSWTLIGDTNSTLGNSSLSKFPNDLDRSLFDTESTIAIYPERKHHRTFIQCYVSLEKVFVDLLMATLIVYGEFLLFNISGIHLPINNTDGKWVALMA